MRSAPPPNFFFVVAEYGTHFIEGAGQGQSHQLNYLQKRG